MKKNIKWLFIVPMIMTAAYFGNLSIQQTPKLPIGKSIQGLKYGLSFNVVQSAFAASTADRLVLLKTLYYLVNGGPDGTWPDGETSSLSGGNAPSDSMKNGMLGLTVNMVQSIGEFYKSQGYTTCDSIPTSGTFTTNDPDKGTLTITNSTSNKTIPNGWVGAGENFEKRIEVVAGANPWFTMHIDCGPSMLTFAIRADEEMMPNEGTANVEILFQGKDEGNEVHLEMLSHNSNSGIGDLALKFDTIDGDMYSIFINFSSSLSDSNGNGPAIVTAGVTGTKSTNKAMLHAQAGDGLGAGSASSDFSDVTFQNSSTPDVFHSSAQVCLDTSTGSVSTGCGTVAAPGTPKVSGMTAWTSAAMDSLGDATTNVLGSVAEY